MCVVIVSLRPGAPEPLLVAANRDEFYDRPADAPSVLSASPWIFGGRDRRSGGSWLVAGGRGLVAAVTNLGSQRPDPGKASRGSLVLDAVRTGSVSAARTFATGLDPLRFNPFNLVVADTTGGFVLSGPRRAVSDLAPGATVVVNEPFGEERGAKACRARSLAGAADLSHDDPDAWRTLLSDHGGPERAGALCRHEETRGTVSSTILAIGSDGAVRRYLHAEGPPCVTAFVPLLRRSEPG